MDIKHCEGLARLTPALHGTDIDSTARPGQRALRAEALRQLRTQLRAWQRVPAVHTTGRPCLIAAGERAKLHDSLDLLRWAGEEVPSWFYQRDSLVRTMDAVGGVVAGVSLASLLADITRVLAWFDSAPSDSDAGVVSERPWIRADAAFWGDDSRARERT